MGAAREHGRTVGRDIAIIGYNDIPPASWLPVPMSSIHSPMVEMGRGGSQVLHDIIAGGHPELVLLSSPPSAPATRPSTSRSEPNHRRDSSKRTNEIGSA